MKKILFLIALITTSVYAQLPPAPFPDGINTKLIQSDTLTTAQRDALTPVANKSTLIFNSTAGEYQFYNPITTSWEALGGGETPTLQAVTDEGATTDNPITVSNATTAAVTVESTGLSRLSELSYDRLRFNRDGFNLNLRTKSLTSNIDLYLPYLTANDTVATQSYVDAATDLSNYVTANTEQTISAKKTFTDRLNFNNKMYLSATSYPLFSSNPLDNGAAIGMHFTHHHTDDTGMSVFGIEDDGFYFSSETNGLPTPKRAMFKTDSIVDTEVYQMPKLGGVFSTQSWVQDYVANNGGSGNPAIYIVDEASDLTGDQSANANKVWSVQGGTIDMSSASITLPEGVYLRYDGGELINGTIDLNGGQVDPELLDYRLTFTDLSGSLKQSKYHFKKAKSGIVESSTDSLTTAANKLRLQHLIDQTHTLYGTGMKIDSLDAYFDCWLDLHRASDEFDNKRSILIPSDFHLEMTDNTYLRIRPDNSFASKLLMSYNTQNVKITGGNLIGDRAAHNYAPVDDRNAQPRNSHEFGTLIYMAGVHNFVIDGVDAFDSTADCLIIDGTTQRWPDTGLVKDGEQVSKNGIIRNSKFRQGRRNCVSVIDGENLLFEDCLFEGAGSGYNFNPDGSIGAWGRLPRTGMDIEPYGETNPENPTESKKYEDAFLITVTKCEFRNNTDVDLNAFKGHRVLVDNCKFTNTLNNQYSHYNTFSNNTLEWDENLREGLLTNNNFTASGGETFHLFDNDTSPLLNVSAMPVGSLYEDLYVTVDGTPLVEGVDYEVVATRDTLNFLGDYNPLTVGEVVDINFYYAHPTPKVGIGINDVLKVHAGGTTSFVNGVRVINNTVDGYDITTKLAGSENQMIGNTLKNFTIAAFSGTGKNCDFKDNVAISSEVDAVGVLAENATLEFEYRKNRFILPNGKLCYLDDMNKTEPYGSLLISSTNNTATIDSIKVNGVHIIDPASPITGHISNVNTTAGYVESAIDSYTSSPDYTATVSANELKIYHETPGDFSEFYTVEIYATGLYAHAADFIKAPREHKISFIDNTILTRDDAFVRNTYGFELINNRTNSGVDFENAYRFKVNDNYDSKEMLDGTFVSGFEDLQDGEILRNNVQYTAGYGVYQDGGGNGDPTGMTNVTIGNNIFKNVGGSGGIRFQDGTNENNVIHGNIFEKDGSQTDIRILNNNNKMFNNYSFTYDLVYDFAATTGNIIHNTIPSLNITSGTELRLRNANGTLYFSEASPSSAATFTIDAELGLFSKAIVYVNRTGAPTVTGATLNSTKGDAFVDATTMKMIVYTDDGVNVRYYFENL